LIPRYTAARIVCGIVGSVTIGFALIFAALIRSVLILSAPIRSVLILSQQIFSALIEAALIGAALIRAPRFAVYPTGPIDSFDIRPLSGSFPVPV
jgi:hypothetical protein